MYTAYILIEANLDKIDELIEQISQIRQVKEVCGIFGVYDILVKIQDELIDEIRDIIKWDIKELFGIRDALTLIKGQTRSGKDSIIDYKLYSKQSVKGEDIITDCVAYLLLNCSLGKEDELIEQISQIRQVKEVCGIFGVYDILVKIRAKSIEEMRYTLSKISKKNHVIEPITFILKPEQCRKSY